MCATNPESHEDDGYLYLSPVIDGVLRTSGSRIVNVKLSQRSYVEGGDFDETVFVRDVEVSVSIGYVTLATIPGTAILVSYSLNEVFALHLNSVADGSSDELKRHGYMTEYLGPLLLTWINLNLSMDK